MSSLMRMSSLETLIQEAREHFAIYERDGWPDGDGPYSMETLEKAFEFTRKIDAECTSNGVDMPRVYFNPGMNGDIDLEWNGIDLLVTVPAEDGGLFGYYGKYPEDGEPIMEIQYDKNEEESAKDISDFITIVARAGS